MGGERRMDVGKGGRGGKGEEEGKGRGRGQGVAGPLSQISGSAPVLWPENIQPHPAPVAFEKVKSGATVITVNKLNNGLEPIAMAYLKPGQHHDVFLTVLCVTVIINFVNSELKPKLQWRRQTIKASSAFKGQLYF